MANYSTIDNLKQALSNMKEALATYPRTQGRPGKSRGLVQSQLEKREALKKLRNFQKMIA
ncbi:hypothetical protein DERF_009176 [Dermatophagoides farinae]|uniref:Uncharacterized protein n=1 Tax=Dermatophagoides farinae TaxID=6954 RepID=A0A922L2A5_DERFA|nr:hypothetical protein DERF_009176 [Dermatophagoides farinae]